ncbi:MAG: tripartite tricarboxylate transporter substrate binding protein [Pseudomonadota bacterium]
MPKVRVVRSVIAVLAAAGLLLAAAAPSALADWSPSGPMKLQIGFGAGGETDTLGRVIASVLEEQTGWDVIAENKPGGGGVAMFTGIAKAKPDGRVIGLGVNMPIMINLVIRGDKLPFDLESFDYLATVAKAQLAIIALKDAPFDDIAGLVAHSKAEGGAPVAFDAKPQELMLQAIDKKDGAGFRLVSTKSSAEMLQFLLGGQVIASFSAGTHIPYVQNGQVKVLASANDGRHSYAPEVLSLREQGYDLFVDPTFYFAAPKGLPEEAKAILAEALDQAISSDKVREVVANALSTEPNNLGPDGTQKMLADGMDGVRILFGK